MATTTETNGNKPSHLNPSYEADTIVKFKEEPENRVHLSEFGSAGGGYSVQNGQADRTLVRKKGKGRLIVLIAVITLLVIGGALGAYLGVNVEKGKDLASVQPNKKPAGLPTCLNAASSIKMKVVESCKSSLREPRDECANYFEFESCLLREFRMNAVKCDAIKVRDMLMDDRSTTDYVSMRCLERFCSAQRDQVVSALSSCHQTYEAEKGRCENYNSLETCVMRQLQTRFKVDCTREGLRSLLRVQNATQNLIPEECFQDVFCLAREKEIEEEFQNCDYSLHELGDQCVNFWKVVQCTVDALGAAGVTCEPLGVFNILKANGDSFLSTYNFRPQVCPATTPVPISSTTAQRTAPCTTDIILSGYELCQDKLTLSGPLCERYEATVSCLLDSVIYQGYVCDLEKVKEVMMKPTNVRYLKQEYGIDPLACSETRTSVSSPITTRQTTFRPSQTSMRRTTTTEATTTTTTQGTMFDPSTTTQHPEATRMIHAQGGTGVTGNTTSPPSNYACESDSPIVNEFANCTMYLQTIETACVRYQKTKDCLLRLTTEAGFACTALRVTEVMFFNANYMEETYGIIVENCDTRPPATTTTPRTSSTTLATTSYTTSSTVSTTLSPTTSITEPFCEDDEPIIDAFVACQYHLELQDIPCRMYQNAVECMLADVIAAGFSCSSSRVEQVMLYPDNVGYLTDTFGVNPQECVVADSS